MATDEKEQNLVRYVNALFQAAERDKAPVAEKVRRFDDLWAGRHWSLDRMRSNRTAAVSNFIFALIETEVTWLLENRPNIITVPVGPDDIESARIVDRIILDYLWPELDIRGKIKRAIRSGLIRGTGYLKVTWDPYAWSGNQYLGGEVAVDYVPWWEMFIDPNADCLDKARYVIHARVMPLSEIVRRWPEKGVKVNPDVRFSGIDGYKVYSADIDKPIITDYASPVDVGNKALVLECWIRDDSYELRKEVSEDGREVEKPEFLYPNGRLIITAGDVVLLDTPNPYNDNSFPFVEFVCYELDNSVWGMGEVEQLELPQRIINLLESRFVDNARLNTNTVWVVSKDAGVDPENIRNQEGDVYVVSSPAARFERMPPSPLPRHYFDLYLQMMRNMEIITGVHEVTQGRRPGGVTAATAISLLQEAGQARIRDKGRNLERFLIGLGRRIISRIIQFYDANRVIRLRSSSGSFEFVQFDPSSVVYGLDVRVEAGTSLQMNEQLRYQTAVELFRLGALDIEGLLDSINWPGRDVLIERFRNQQAMTIAKPQPPEPTPGGDLLGTPKLP